jgi:lysophospholipase L1-like esterase
VHSANGQRRFVAIALAVAAVCASSASLPAGAATKPSPVVEAGDTYVALGSSFASGPMIPPVADASCLRSTDDYPGLVARRLGLTLTDVSCGAATTDNVISTPQGVHPVQLDALTPDTDLVTITIGGNDVDYSATNLICSGDAKNGQDCLGTSVQPNDIEAKFAALPAKLDATLQAIEAKAPKATVVVVPYLRVFPAVPAPCAPSVPMSTPTLYYLTGSSDKLHTAIKEAAARAEVRFVDTYVPKGHDACAVPAKRWVEGAEPASPAVSFHPNAAGMKAQAKMIVAALQKPK